MVRFVPFFVVAEYMYIRRVMLLASKLNDDDDDEDDAKHFRLS